MKIFGKEYAIISVKWSNDYTNPPEGSPRILFGFSCPWPTPYREELMKLADKHASMAPVGYSVHIWFRSMERIKRWPPERMAAVRLRNLKERVMKKDPLFYDEMIAWAIAKKPEYFDPTAISKEIEQRVKKELWWEEKLLTQYVKDSGV